MSLALLAAVLVLSGPPALPLRPRAPEPTLEPTFERVKPGPRLARLDLAEEPSAPRSRGEAASSPEERARRDAVVDALVAAEAQATESPETAAAPLLAALQRFSDVAPLVADDARAQQARVFAQLALARTHLVLEQPQAAADALDDALRTARGEPLPIAQFGPTMVALHDERVAAMALLAPATLDVRCGGPCRVLVDERPFDSEHPALPPGAHRVWVEAMQPGLPVLRRALELQPGDAVELAYAVEAPESTAEPVAEPVELVEPAPRRILPRWAAGVGIGVGAGLVGVGGGLVGVDHRCPDLSDPRTHDCLEILNTDTAGFVLLGVGSAMLVSAAVILVVDEVRARRARKSR